MWLRGVLDVVPEIVRLDVGTAVDGEKVEILLPEHVARAGFRPLTGLLRLVGLLRLLLRLQVVENTVPAAPCQQRQQCN